MSVIPAIWEVEIEDYDPGHPRQKKCEIILEK
jgi:hypothetical protein